MMKVKGITNFGLWLKRGEEVCINNNLGSWAVQKGYAEFIDYVNIKADKRTSSVKEMRERKKLFRKYNIPIKNTYGMTLVLNLLRKLEEKRDE